jgi:CPA1 family monovalent cation:H+ antiporter
MDDGRPFPDRDLVLFLAFAVILVTLVGQGMTLPAVIRVLGLAKAGERELQTDRSEELSARRQAIEAATEHLDQLAAERELPDDVVRQLRTNLGDRLRHFEPTRGQGENQDRTAVADQIELALITAERERINDLYRRGTLKDEARRRLERELDLRESNLTSHQHDVG